MEKHDKLVCILGYLMSVCSIPLPLLGAILWNHLDDNTASRSFLRGSICGSIVAALIVLILICVH